MKAMILDVDGTLWDTTGVVAEAWMQAASELMIPPDTPITADRLKQEFGKPMDEIAANLFPTLSESQRALVMESCCEYEEFYLENAREPLLFRRRERDDLNTVTELCCLHCLQLSERIY